MLNKKLSWFALAAAVFACPASAQDKTEDFDRLNLDVRRIVLQAKDDAAAAEAGDVEGKEVQSRQTEAAVVARRIVVFQKGVSRARRMSLVRGLGGVPTKDLWLINAVAVVGSQAQIQRLDAQGKANGDILRIEEDFVQNWLSGAGAVSATSVLMSPASLPSAGADMSLPREGEEPPQRTPWGIGRVNARKAWEVTRGAGIKVAVVDTGIDFTHPDLKIEGGFNTIDASASYKDDHGHGTHVAGTIAAQDNGRGVVGVAPDVKLWGVKVLSASGSGTFADVIEGIQWTVENRMDIANFSLGASRGTEALADAVKACAEAGVALIAAAGNSGGAVGYPAAYPGALAVAASDSSDGVAYFSSRGPEVAVIAPGVDVESTWMGGGYDTISGTSMACPHAVGLAALAAAAQGVRGIYAIRAALKKAATKIPNVPDEQQGSGIIDAGKLVAP